MKQTLYNYQTLSRADKIKAIVVLFFMGILLVILGFLVGTLFRQRTFEFSIPSLPVQATKSALIPVTAPTSYEQLEDCNFSTLVLGTTTFEIQNLPPGTDGSLAVPGDTTGIAYRVNDTDDNAVFVLSPTPQNIAVMATISIGSPARMQGPGCTPVTYSLSAPLAGALDGSIFSSGSMDSITIFFPTVSSGAGFVFKGRLARSGE